MSIVDLIDSPVVCSPPLKRPGRVTFITKQPIAFECTGDADIDNTLMQYRRPLKMALLGKPRASGLPWWF